MSTDHQQYSTENQADAIRQYAARRGIEIVRTYADDGKSGLSLDGRDSSSALLHDVQNGRTDFSLILVYDISRWGRFQDADEAAHNEFICRRVGIDVHYCAEPFENDGSFGSDIQKMLKRKMAGEYSRETFGEGICRAMQVDRAWFSPGRTGRFWHAAAADRPDGCDKSDAGPGEQKSIQTDRVVLVPGPADEVTTVRWMYRAFVDEGRPEREIAGLLNAQGILTDQGRPWTRGTVHQVLINEKYVGNNVWNRMSFKLKKKRVQNSPDHWVRADGVFESLIDHQLFEAARAIIHQRSIRFSDEEMLDSLRRLREERGQISGLVIDEADGLPSSFRVSQPIWQSTPGL